MLTEFQVERHLLLELVEKIISDRKKNCENFSLEYKNYSKNMKENYYIKKSNPWHNFCHWQKSVML